MSADVEDDNELPNFDLSFLERQPARAADIPNLSERGERTEDHEPHISIQQEAKTLTVGRDISLKGDITECDALIVEGRIDATLGNARSLEISRGGFFLGTANVETATISGQFDGDLNVTHALLITASGKVTGNVSYGSLEIKQGGQILGDIRIHG